jgi:hypothetical protein
VLRLGDRAAPLVLTLVATDEALVGRFDAGGSPGPVRLERRFRSTEQRESGMLLGVVRP